MYTLIIDYFATGEGRTVWLARIGATNKAAAVLKFKDSFVNLRNDDAAWDYFSIDLEVYDDNDPKEIEVAKKYVRTMYRKAFTNSVFANHIGFITHYHYNHYNFS